ncbi:MAG: hypothetical protein KIT69_19355, partial [Propionibacteriaceae bacterium]|nr:hypothetical protein [Propionibacteriaceae bacterium]
DSHGGTNPDPPVSGPACHRDPGGVVGEHGRQMPRSVRSGPETIQLRVTSPPSANERTARLATVPVVPWAPAAAIGGAGAALLGWLLIVGVAGVAWFTASAIPLPDVLAFCAGFWLLAHGGGVEIAGSAVTLMPLGLTLTGAMLAMTVGRFAAGQAWLARPGAQRVSDRLRLAAQVAGLTGLGYTAIAVALGVTVGDWGALAAPGAGALGIAAVAGFAGALRGRALRPDDLLPGWLADALRGGAAGFLALLAVGAIVLGLAMLLGAERVAAIEDGLRLDGAGFFVWAVLALAYLPTVLLWGSAWALGGGITVGTGSLVTISGTKLGMLPAIPLLGGLPPAGLTPDFTIAWLGSGVVAGLLAGMVAVGRPGADPRGLPAAGRAVAVALIAGLVTTGLLLAAAWASIGSLGALRLVDLGPRLLELALIAGPMIGLAALFGGLGRWLVGMLRSRRAVSIS